MATIFDKLCSLFENGISNDEDRELLANSLFYYCCGKDPTPIRAFGAAYPLYVYADIIDYGRENGNFYSETKKLYRRVRRAGNVLVASRKLQGAGPVEGMKNAVVTLWSPRRHWFSRATTAGTSFGLLYVQCDAAQAYKKIYNDNGETGNAHHILPNCVCNYRYEFCNQCDTATLSNLLNNVEYVMGYCYNDNYKRVAEYDYYGDWGCRKAKVQLLRRMCAL